MTRWTRTPVLIFAFLAGSLAAGPLLAAPMKVSTNLTASSEVPPTKSDGTGSLSGTFDPTTRKLSYTVTYKGLTGPATMAHFHGPAPTGQNAGVEVPIKGALESPIHGDVTLTPEQAKDLTGGMMYFNIHTGANPKGEVRGQVLAD